MLLMLEPGRTCAELICPRRLGCVGLLRSSTSTAPACALTTKARLEAESNAGISAALLPKMPVSKLPIFSSFRLTGVRGSSSLPPQATSAALASSVVIKRRLGVRKKAKLECCMGWVFQMAKKPAVVCNFGDKPVTLFAHPGGRQTRIEAPRRQAPCRGLNTRGCEPAPHPLRSGPMRAPALSLALTTALLMGGCSTPPPSSHSAPLRGTASQLSDDPTAMAATRRIRVLTAAVSSAMSIVTAWARRRRARWRSSAAGGSRLPTANCAAATWWCLAQAARHRMRASTWARGASCMRHPRAARCDWTTCNRATGRARTHRFAGSDGPGGPVRVL